MPYDVVKTSRCPAGKPWGVVKSTGDRKLLGCHETKAEAESQRRAVEANENDAAELKRRVEEVR